MNSGVLSRRTTSLASRIVLCVAIVQPASARGQDRDPWFGRDKLLHFGASATIAGGGYGVGAMTFDARYEAMLLGGGVALSAGVAKEVRDSMGYGDPSWRDLAWDVIGTATGLGIAWGIDLAIRGTGPSHPVWGVRNQPRTVTVGLRF